MSRLFIQSLLTLSIISLLSCFTNRYATSIPDQHRVKTIAIVESQPLPWFPNKYNHTHFGTYVANGKEYSMRMPSDAPIGSKFVIYYDSLQPINYDHQHFSQPIFTEDEQTASSAATLTSVNIARSDKYSSKVWFEYTARYQCKTCVDKQKWYEGRFSGSQLLDSSVHDRAVFHRGARFQVTYWPEDPNRAIIRLDKPIAPDSSQYIRSKK